MNSGWPWVVLALLGAYHGLNPAMGWLFALALGLQEKSRSVVIRAFLPIAVGHAAAIAVALLLLRLVQEFVSPRGLKWGVASVLLVLGVYRLFCRGHLRGGGMRVGSRDLALWSFLMASAHGAGLMLVPVLLAHPTMEMSHHTMVTMTANAAVVSLPITLFAVSVHTVAMLIVAGVLAILVYESYDKFGVGFLRHTWFNFDLLWAIALIVAGISVLWF
jgi:hypothetical protein